MSASADDAQSAREEERKRTALATGEREDHHNSAPGVEVAGGSGTDPAGEVPGKPKNEKEPGKHREDEGLSPI